ncbi:glucosaminidase domain-containing protein [Shewanella sp. NIFS-20-20]|uniref:glucosaminidase domain-containing protein n=1 Tax=Shewanella sp. NIFS-20-20 TaxID=2853806 RepID=UPI001C45B4A0|nr:glucosaminidase domain-containing protein [Shewanella sp. NIFS-20-20]MBV7316513.1 glucosaminidase domain-containing protein [Shewanella sp. NIFS-20-20]
MKNKILYFILLMFCSLAVAKDDLPLPPDMQPIPVTAAIDLSDANAMLTYFAEQHYQLPLAKPPIVPPILTKNLPENFHALPHQAATTGFIQLLLPNILAVNDQLKRVRQALLAIKHAGGPKIAAETAWLKKISFHYQLGAVDINKMLLHIDAIPVGMVLAQAIDESGWGTSRFARQGDALFGEHSPKGWPYYMTTAHGRIKVASYDTVYQGVAAYIYNLNTQASYASFRQLRATLSPSAAASGYQLVAGLRHYSAHGWDYVNDLRALINHHHLDSYDDAELQSHDWQWIEFSR